MTPEQYEQIGSLYNAALEREPAEALKVSPDTVTRDWNQAKAWLYRALNSSP